MLNRLVFALTVLVLLTQAQKQELNGAQQQPTKPTRLYSDVVIAGTNANKPGSIRSKPTSSPAPPPPPQPRSFEEYDEEGDEEIIGESYKPFSKPSTTLTERKLVSSPSSNDELPNASNLPADENDNEQQQELDPSPSSPTQKIAQANNRFTQDYYKIVSQRASPNFVFSPFSMMTLLGMLRAGAGGKTLSEIQDVMNAGSSSNVLYSGFKGLLSNLQAPAKRTNTNFTATNRLYIQKGFNITEDFQRILKTDFNAPAQQLDFEGPNPEKLINELVRLDTQNLIQNLIEPGVLNNLTRMVTVSTLYFKGGWENAFHGKATKRGDFFKLNGDVVPVEMMSTEDYFRVANIQSLNAKAIALPYVGKQMEMIILLPNTRNGLPDLERKLVSDRNYFTDISNSLKGSPRNVYLHLPKFQLETTQDLQEPLRTLGVKQAFQQFVADFSRVSPSEGDLYLSKVIQKAFLKVNEAGSEAGAASYGAVFTPLSIGPPLEETIRVDHPFLGFLRHVETNLILFTFRKME